MPKKTTEISSTINNITALISNDIIDYEGLRQKVEDEMRKQEIEKKYGNQIQQMPNGLWWIRLETGRVIKLTKRENVIKKLIELEKENSVQEYTLLTFWDLFFEHRKLSQAKGTVRIDKRYFNRFIAPKELAQIPLSQITITEVEAWATECLKMKTEKDTPIKAKYFDGVCGTLSQMFQYAEDCKLITSNPVEKLDIHADNFAPKAIHRDEDDIFLPDEEPVIKQLAYEDSKNKEDAIPLGIPLLLNIGVRDGEMCALHWRDVEGNYLHIQSEMVEDTDENAVFDGYRWVDHCKSKAGNRFVPLNSEARTILANVKKLNLMNGFGITQDDFIFQRVYKGEVCECTSRCFESRIKKYCRQAGMDVLKSQHDARRTFATNLFYAGMQIKNISKIMGHETIEQTEAYIKCRPETNEFEYMERLCNRNKSEQQNTEFLNIKKIGNA